MPDPDAEALDRRLGAVERALTDDDCGPADLADAAAVTGRVERTEDRLAAVERRVSDLEAATRALRGYLGTVRDESSTDPAGSGSALSTDPDDHRESDPGDHRENGSHADPFPENREGRDCRRDRRSEVDAPGDPSSVVATGDPSPGDDTGDPTSADADSRRLRSGIEPDDRDAREQRPTSGSGREEPDGSGDRGGDPAGTGDGFESLDDGRTDSGPTAFDWCPVPEQSGDPPTTDRSAADRTGDRADRPEVEREGNGSGDRADRTEIESEEPSRESERLGIATGESGSRRPGADGAVDLTQAPGSDPGRSETPAGAEDRSDVDPEPERRRRGGTGDADDASWSGAWPDGVEPRTGPEAPPRSEDQWPPEGMDVDRAQPWAVPDLDSGDSVRTDEDRTLLDRIREAL